MGQHTEYLKQAELAVAAYGNFSSSEPTIQELEDTDFSEKQANFFIAKYEVVDQHNDVTGLSATVFKDNIQTNPIWLSAARTIYATY